MGAWLQGTLCGNCWQTQTQLLKTTPEIVSPSDILGVALEGCRSCWGKL